VARRRVAGGRAHSTKCVARAAGRWHPFALTCHSHRADGKAILEVATALIETAPGRPDRPALRPSDDNPPGVFKYLRFATETAEQVGVADLVANLVREGLKPSDIVILMRSDSNSQWSKPVRAALEKRRIAVTDVETAA
jgi:superfamily I DNA/RNA helicase